MPMRKALLIANTKYKNLDDLAITENDVLSLKSLLEDKNYGNFDVVKSVIDETGIQNMNNEIFEFYNNCNRDDFLLFYYSGHGILDNYSEFYIAMNDYQEGKEPTTAYPIYNICNYMKRYSRANAKAVILDCCYSGAIKESFFSKKGPSSINSYFLGTGTSILTSSKHYQVSYFEKNSLNSTFTKLMIEGIKSGKADYSNDGIIDFKNLYRYISEKIDKQNPQLFENLDKGSIYISQNPNLEKCNIEEKSEIKTAKEIAEKNRINKKLLKKSLVGLLIISLLVFGGVLISNLGSNESKDKNEMTSGTNKLAIETDNTVVRTDKTPIETDEKKNLINNDLIDENFVQIKGGKFEMGSPTSEVSRFDRELQHTVKLDDFYMGKYEVTVKEFNKFIKDENYKTESDLYNKFNTNDRKPVLRVSWNGATEYCKWLSEIYDGVYRLPTEAEWEYACRAGTKTPFNTGDNLTTAQANYDGNYPYDNNEKGKYIKDTTNVGSYSPNKWGLYNMHCNVREWCGDWYDENYYQDVIRQ